MKKTIGITLFIPLLIILVGCENKTEIVSCIIEKEDSGFIDNSKLNITYENNLPIDLEMTTMLEVMEADPEESVENIKVMFDEVYKDISLNDGIDISADLEENNIIININIDYNTIKEEGSSRVSGTLVPSEAFDTTKTAKEMKEMLETAGYICTVEAE